MNVKLKIYRGYSNEQELILFGHVFRKRTPGQFGLEGKKFRHAYAVLRMFTIKTLGNVSVTLKYGDRKVETKTLEDGFFRFALPYSESVSSGWHRFTVSINIDGTYVEEEGEFVKPYQGGYGVISDIDDTFLISHSDNFFKKIYVLLTRNVKKRRLFKGVVEHYRLLSTAGNHEGNATNTFFYVSSSEWNLYHFITSFAELHELPKAVLKLKNIKTSLGDFLFTGGGSHDHKFFKIKHLLEFYPGVEFILLGDDSQKDPFIYERIVKLFPIGIRAVYIRRTGKGLKQKVQTVMSNIGSMDVEICYFGDSAEAIEHSKKIGLISKTEFR